MDGAMFEPRCTVLLLATHSILTPTLPRDESMIVSDQPISPPIHALLSGIADRIGNAAPGRLSSDILRYSSPSAFNVGN